ncbi:MAG: VOC family protein [Bacteroidota bacterium]
METKTAFAPMLTIRNGVTDIDFYKNAFNAVEHMRLKNDDGSIHVAEFTIDDALFHLHEVMPRTDTFNPEQHTGVVTLGLMTADVHAVFNQAVAAGATILSPVTDFEYGYRQGDLKDPFGHHWTIQCRIPASPDWKG